MKDGMENKRASGTFLYIIVYFILADFMRPVVILGALADLVRYKLLEEMPDRFDVPSMNSKKHFNKRF